MKTSDRRILSNAEQAGRRNTERGFGRMRVAGVASLALALVMCSCSKDDPKLHRIGFPYSESVWVDYLFDEARPGNPVIIVNPYSDRVVGQRAGGIRDGVIRSNWTTEKLGTDFCGWQVELRADPPAFHIAGKTGSLKNGRFIILTDSKAREFPQQIDIPIPGGMKSETEIRKWLDGVRDAGVTGLSVARPAASKGMASEHAEAKDLHAMLAAEREMMTQILAGGMHHFSGVTDAPRDTIAYHGLHSYQSADNYEDRAFIPWNGKAGYVVFEVKPGLGPFRYYGITVGENGKSGVVGAAGIVEAGDSNAEDGN